MQSVSRAHKPQWEWLVLFWIALVPRLYLLRVFDIELSNDGFDSVNTLTTFQIQGIAAIPTEGITRFVLHPLYMLLLYALKITMPTSIDFYIVARLFSTLVACIAILLLFEFVRRAFGDYVAWVAALLLVFAPSFLWESTAILSSTLFLTLYLAVLLTLAQSRYGWAALFAFLSAITRAEGTVLIALVFIALIARDVRARRFHLNDWLVCGALALAVPLTILGSSWFATGNPLEFLRAQSIASIWLRFLASPDLLKRASFFITQYPALFPAPIVWLGMAGAVIALIGHRHRVTALLFAASALYLLFFETLVWFNYTTLEVRFLIYPGLPLLIFAGVALADARGIAIKRSRVGGEITVGVIVIVLFVMSYQQGDAGIRFVYNMHATQREVADELARLVPPNQQTNVVIYGGVAGALDFFARQRGLQLAFTYFRFAPDDDPEQFLLDRKIQFIIYPVGNAFAKAKYPYLARFETQAHGPVTFQPLTQFSTSLDNQLYSIWAIVPNEPMHK
jgi:hypothetical protein